MTPVRIFIAVFVPAGLALCLAFKRPPAAAAIDPCLKEVKEIYDRMYTMLPGEGKVYFFSYRIVSTLSAKDRNGRNIVNASDIEMYSARDQYRFISKYISVYQDKESRFTVLPAQKVIYRADSDMGLLKGNRLDRMKKIQDTIFSYAEVTDCQPVKEKTADKVIRVKLQKKFAQYMQINKVTYYLDSKHQELKRLQIDYPDTREVVALDFIFNEANYDYKKMTPGPVKNMFIGSDNKLKESYRDYKLIDVRKKE